MGRDEGGVRLPQGPAGAPIDVPHRSHRNGVRDAPCAVPVPRGVAVPRRGAGDRAAVLRARRGRARGRAHGGLGEPGPPPGPRGHLGGRPVGRGDRGLRRGGRPPVVRARVPGLRRRGGRDLRGVSEHDPAALRAGLVAGKAVRDPHPGGDRRATPGRPGSGTRGGRVQPGGLGRVGRAAVHRRHGRPRAACPGAPPVSRRGGAPDLCSAHGARPARGAAGPGGPEPLLHSPGDQADAGRSGMARSDRGSPCGRRRGGGASARAGRPAGRTASTVEGSRPGSPRT